MAKPLAKFALILVNLIIFSIWSIIPLSWAYFLLSVHRLAPFRPIYPLQSISNNTHPLIHYPIFFYSSLEVSFSIWHFLQVRRIQAPGPAPLYGRRFLRQVFSRALSSGMNPENHTHVEPHLQHSKANPEKIESYLDKNENKGGHNLRQRNHQSFGLTPMTPTATSSSISSSGQAFPMFSPSLAPLTPGAAKRVVRLRANSYVPEFVQRPLTKSDPRAQRFHELQSLWFKKPNPETIITRRDMETWLAWALYGVRLEAIEEERAQLLEKRARRDHQGDDYFGNSPDTSPPPSPIPPTTPSFGANPPKSRSSRIVRDGFLSPEVEPSTFSKMQQESRLNEEAELDWEQVDGDRYDFLMYCRELVEARQGFSFPIKVVHKKETITNGVKQVKEVPQEEVPSMRLTIDKVKVSSRPLLLYLVTNALTYFTIYKACRKGFKKEREGRLEYLILRPDGWTREKAEEDSKYVPIWFFHGLGIGLAQYAALIYFFLDSTLRRTHPIVIPLQPHISQDIFSKDWLDPPGHHEFTDCLHRLIVKEGWETCGVSIISHSFGTIRHSHVLKSLGSFVKRSCFVDPVCFQLWIGWVCGNFLYFPCRHDVVKLVMRWFVGRELGTANQFRYFDWSSNILWPEDEIPNIRSPYHTRFFLAGKDAILNAPETRNYLREHGVKDVEEGGNMFMNWNAVHGEILMHGGEGMQNIVAWLEEGPPS